jgi:hypothetical protein
VKTLVDCWILESGGYMQTFPTKEAAIMEMTDSEFLEYFPDQTVLSLRPGYVVVELTK